MTALLLLPLATPAQDFPTRPIRIVVGSPPGGGTDIISRLLGEKLQARWGQPVIAENRGGGGGNIGAEVVYRANPDGYTLFVVSQGALVINKSLYAKLSYDPDLFVPVSLLAATPAVLLIHPSVPATTLQQFIAYNRANPGKLNYASQGIGTSAHLTAELFNSLAGIKAVHVAYRGTGPALIDLVGGQVAFLFGELATAGAYVSSGKLRVLGVASEKRSPLAPDLTVIAESLPGFVSTSWWGMVAPPATPPAIAARLSGAVAEAMKQPDVAKRMNDLSIEGIGSTPEELAAWMRRERETWGRVVRMTGATAE